MKLTKVHYDGTVWCEGCLSSAPGGVAVGMLSRSPDALRDLFHATLCHRCVRELRTFFVNLPVEGP